MTKYKQLESITVSSMRAVSSKSDSTDSKCAQCFDSKCCQYITEPLDTPRSIRDFDMLLWQVSHKNIHCFKDESGWYLTVFGQCEHLTDKGECGIYQKRPFICREHSDQDCEFDTPQHAFSELYFSDYDSFDEYCRQRFKRWDKRFE